MCLYFLQDDAMSSLYKVSSSYGKAQMAGMAQPPEHPVLCRALLAALDVYFSLFIPAHTHKAPVYSPFQFCLPRGQNSNLPKI